MTCVLQKKKRLNLSRMGGRVHKGNEEEEEKKTNKQTMAMTVTIK